MAWLALLAGSGALGGASGLLALLRTCHALARLAMAHAPLTPTLTLFIRSSPQPAHTAAGAHEQQQQQPPEPGPFQPSASLLRLLRAPRLSIKLASPVRWRDPAPVLPADAARALWPHATRAITLDYLTLTPELLRSLGHHDSGASPARQLHLRACSFQEAGAAAPPDGSAAVQPMPRLEEASWEVYSAPAWAREALVALASGPALRALELPDDLAAQALDRLPGLSMVSVASHVTPATLAALARCPGACHVLIACVDGGAVTEPGRAGGAAAPACQWRTLRVLDAGLAVLPLLPCFPEALAAAAQEGAVAAAAPPALALRRLLLAELTVYGELEPLLAGCRVLRALGPRRLRLMPPAAWQLDQWVHDDSGASGGGQLEVSGEPAGDGGFGMARPFKLLVSGDAGGQALPHVLRALLPGAACGRRHVPEGSVALNVYAAAEEDGDKEEKLEGLTALVVAFDREVTVEVLEDLCDALSEAASAAAADGGGGGGGGGPAFALRTLCLRGRFSDEALDALVELLPTFITCVQVTPRAQPLAPAMHMVVEGGANACAIAGEPRAPPLTVVLVASTPTDRVPVADQVQADWRCCTMRPGDPIRRLRKMHLMVAHLKPDS